MKFKKKRDDYEVKGFRKGKAPRKAIEDAYGPDVFLVDAVQRLIQEAYKDAVHETDLDIVAPPIFEGIQGEIGKPLRFAITVAVRPEVKLGMYKGLEVWEDPVSVSEEEVETEIRKALEKKGGEARGHGPSRTGGG